MTRLYNLKVERCICEQLQNPTTMQTITIYKPVNIFYYVAIQRCHVYVWFVCAPQRKKTYFVLKCIFWLSFALRKILYIHLCLNLIKDCMCRSTAEWTTYCMHWREIREALSNQNLTLNNYAINLQSRIMSYNAHAEEPTWHTKKNSITFLTINHKPCYPNCKQRFWRNIEKFKSPCPSVCLYVCMSVWLSKCRVSANLLNRWIDTFETSHSCSIRPVDMAKEG